MHPRGPLFVCPLPGQVQNHGCKSARRESGIRAHSPRAEVQPRGWRPRAVRGMQARRYRAHPAPRPSPGGAVVLRPPFAARPPPPRTPLLSPGCAARSALPVPAAPGGAAGPHGRRGAAPASGQRGAALSPAEPRSGTGASRSAARGGYERDMMMIDSQVSCALSSFGFVTFPGAPVPAAPQRQGFPFCTPAAGLAGAHAYAFGFLRVEGTSGAGRSGNIGMRGSSTARVGYGGCCGAAAVPGCVRSCSAQPGGTRSSPSPLLCLRG